MSEPPPSQNPSDSQQRNQGANQPPQPTPPRRQYHLRPDVDPLPSGAGRRPPSYGRPIIPARPMEGLRRTSPLTLDHLHNQASQENTESEEDDDREMLEIIASINQYWDIEMDANHFSNHERGLTPKQCKWELCYRASKANDLNWSEEMYGPYPPSTDMTGNKAIPMKMFNQLFEIKWDNYLAGKAERAPESSQNPGQGGSTARGGS